MATCKLCKSKEANKKNSHIFPYFLINGPTNFPGRTGKRFRSNELLFTFSNVDGRTLYKGKAITDSDMDELYKEKVSEFSLDEKNALSEDFILCECCEERLGRVEGYFSDKITQLLTKSGTITQKHDTVKIRLFIISLFWRGAIAQKSGFALKRNPKLVEQLRVILNQHLNGVVEDSGDQLNIDEIPLIGVFYEPIDDPSKGFILPDPYSENPYFLVIGNHTFMLFPEKKPKGIDINSMFELKGDVKIEHINYKEEQFQFLYLDKFKYEKLILNTVNYFATNWVLGFREGFIRAFEYQFKKRPSKPELEFYDQYFQKNMRSDMTSDEAENLAIDVIVMFLKDGGPLTRRQRRSLGLR